MTRREWHLKSRHECGHAAAVVAVSDRNVDKQALLYRRRCVGREAQFTRLWHRVWMYTELDSLETTLGVGVEVLDLLSAGFDIRASRSRHYSTFDRRHARNDSKLLTLPVTVTGPPSCS